jgi:putative ABC transport system permease protein
VEAANELKVCPRVTDNIIEGRFLAADGADEAVIAAGLSKGIRAELGDSVIIVANTEDGFQNAIEVEVVGIIEEKIAQANARLVYLPAATAQRLLYMDDKVNEIVMKTDGKEGIETVNRAINNRLRGRLLRSSTWKEVATFFVDVMRKQNVIILAVCFIFYFIVMSSITNTMTLAVFERKREIGTMMAVGLKPGYITRLIVVEGMLIGLLGSTAGVLASIAVIVILGGVGLTRTPPGSLAPVTIRPFISWPFMMVSFGLGILSAVVASIYPARRTLEVDPADALRSV